MLLGGGLKTNLYIMLLVSCIWVLTPLEIFAKAKKEVIGVLFLTGLTLCASCILEVSPESVGESPYTTDALIVFFTGNGLGELKPCGCLGGQLGGLDRRAAVFNRVPRDKRLIIDTGSFVKSDSEQDLIKFNIILQALKLLDYDLVSLSEEDIEIGKNVGLLDGTGPIFNIISPHGSSDMNIPAKFAKSLSFKDKRVVITVAAFDAESDFDELSRAASIEQIGQLFGSGSDVNSAEVNSESNLNILILSHCDDAIIDFITERIPLVDCIVCPSESDEPMVVGEANKRPLVFSVGRFGRYISGLQITEDRGQKTEDRGQITEAAGGEDKPILSFFTIPVEEDLEEEASLVQLYKDYQQLVRERNLLEKYPRFILPDGLEYAGSESCKSCHEYEYGKWSRNVHAHAYSILERAGSQFDPECVFCHVVGMEYESGFVSEQKTGHLKNVGCESCHGPGSEHIMTAGQTELTEPKSACIDCHTPEHSGDYAGNESSFQKKIIHWREPKPLAPVK